MNTFDFGSTARPVASRKTSFNLWPRKKTSSSSTNQKPTQTTSLQKSIQSWLLSLAIWLVGGTAVVMSTSYVALRFVLPNLLPLTATQTMLLVPSDPATEDVYVAVFNIGEPSMTLVSLNRAAIPSLTGSLSLPDINQRVGKMLDQVIILKPEQDITDPDSLIHLLQTTISQKTFGLSRSEKMRLWLFAQALPSTKKYARDINSQLAWQQFVINSAQQMPLRDCTIALVNTTSVAGLGRAVSQLLEQSGYQIVRVDSVSEALPYSTLHVAESKASCQKYAERISKNLFGQPEIVTDNEQPALYRADMVLFLGQDVGKIGT